MTTRDGPVSRASRVAAEDERRVIAELARAQRAAGLSDLEVGRASRMSRWTVARILSGRRSSSVVEMAAIGGAVGLDIRLQAFPAGDPIRDAGQQRLVERFRRRLHASLGWSTEVPLPDDRDRRAWDAVVTGTDWRAGVEAETVLSDLQALERRIGLKARDGDMSLVLVVVADTRRNRRALTAAPAAFGSFSRDAGATLRALGRAERPPASALVLL